MSKTCVIFGGGVISNVANHFAISAPAAGKTARTLADMFAAHPECNLDVVTHLSRMASPTNYSFETIEELQAGIDETVADYSTKIVVMNCALPNFEAVTRLGLGERIPTSEAKMLMLKAAPKVIESIRVKQRKDIFLVAFKTTCGATEREMFDAGLKLMKRASCNLVLVNDTTTKLNLIVTPEEATYHVTTDREDALWNLVDMAMRRSHLTFTRSTVVSDEGVAWDSPLIPDNLRATVNWCIEQNAYKEGFVGSGATVGHFACKVSDTEFITSKRKTDFRQLKDIGMTRIVTDGPDTVLAYGGKPSVGGQSQRIVFTEHDGMDCIVHFHCPLLENPSHTIPVVSQREYECGSHQCGENTSRGLGEFTLEGGHSVKAVYLDQHGPNIVFSRDTPAEAIIDFIRSNFDLSAKTDGHVRTDYMFSEERAEIARAASSDGELPDDVKEIFAQLETGSGEGVGDLDPSEVDQRIADWIVDGDGTKASPRLQDLSEKLRRMTKSSEEATERLQRETRRLEAESAYERTILEERRKREWERDQDRYRNRDHYRERETGVSVLPLNQTHTLSHSITGSRLVRNRGY